jgi:hypothetical protein
MADHIAIARGRWCPEPRHRSRVSSARRGSFLDMSVDVVGYGPGDVARGVREEPVEERDAYVVGQRQALSAWEPRPRASLHSRRTW